jgi:hypothetical protein
MVWGRRGVVRTVGGRLLPPNDLRISCRDRLETASDAGAGRPGPGSFIRGLARRPEPTPAARRCIPRPPRPHGREPVMARRNGARRHLAEPGAPGPTRRQRRPSMCRAPRRPVVLAPRNSLVSSAHWPDSASVRSTPTIISWAPRTAALANVLGMSCNARLVIVALS